MKEAIFGLVGVIIGSALSWLQTHWIYKRSENKNARYLAIRCVCILDKFVEDCMDVIKDNGLSYGQRNAQGCLEPQVKLPGPPIFPADIDWKSIDHETMYKLLSFTSDVEAGDRLIDFTQTIACPPDYEDFFEERKYHYCKHGLNGCLLSKKIATKYGIKKKQYDDWDPESDLTQELDKITKIRQQQIKKRKDIVSSTLKFK
jgi:hypothetical protein